MAYKGAKQGWYRVLNPEKFIQQMQESKTVMKSTRINEGFLEIEYKSGLERTAFRYCDMNKYIKKFSIEPFAIKYLSPKDGKIHRYFVDLFIEFENSQKFLVEIKPFSETIEPKKPQRKTEKALLNYQKALQTFAVNTAKWKAAEAFVKEKGLKFIILTERELK